MESNWLNMASQLLGGKHRYWIWFLLIGLTAFYFCLPRTLFDVPYSQVLFDKNGRLMSAKVAADEQWRFAPPDSIPSKFEQAILQFEDKRFYYHPGVDFLSLGRAIYQNIRKGSIVSGASTLTMQVIRLSRNQPRTILEKCIEMILAIRLEVRHSKQEILNLYAGHAPFGGNVVGLEAACWRYFNRTMYQLSWSEACFLAVLPNSPGMLHPGKNRKALTDKRNRLLKKLLDADIIDKETYKLALDEKIPSAPKALPQEALHLLEFMIKSNPNTKGRYQSTVDLSIQRRIKNLMEVQNKRLSRNGIYNMAAVVVDLEGNIVSYQGNISPPQSKHAPDVDIVQAPRSTGSIIKPFLFGLSLQRALKMPDGLVQDVPVYFNGYSPKNANHDYLGMVPYSEALVKSLNIPFVNNLQEYGVGRFLTELKQMGFQNFSNSAEHYGLTLILGGAEVSLYELVQQYLNMARTVRNFPEHQGRYCKGDLAPIRLAKEIQQTACNPTDRILYMDAGAAYHTLQSMKKVIRPESEGNWQHFNSSYPIAWKTGTSFGAKDAWAVGMNPDYVVGVWVGNADGEGRPGISGIQAAAPVLFDIFDLLPLEHGFFEAPLNAMQPIPICQESGYRAHTHCPTVDTTLLAACLVEGPQCRFHKEIYIDPISGQQVNSACFPVFEMKKDTIFEIPAFPFHYYSQVNPLVRSAPRFKMGCKPQGAKFRIAYPYHGARLYLAKDLDSEVKPFIAKVFHEQAEARLFWHLNDQYIGQTQFEHALEIKVPGGKYLLKVVDELGNERAIQFEVAQKK